MAFCAVAGLLACDKPIPCVGQADCPPHLVCNGGRCTQGLGAQGDAGGGAGNGGAGSGCGNALAPIGRGFAAATPFDTGLLIVGGDPGALPCTAASPALADAAVVEACGGTRAAPALPPLPTSGGPGGGGAGGRLGAMAARHPITAAVWLVGGRGHAPDGEPTGQVLQWHAGAAAWQPATAAVTPRSHGGMAATTTPPALWLFGGDIGPNGTPIATFELRRLHGQATSWELVAAGGQTPGARRNFGFCSLGTRLALFGGVDATDALRAEVHVLRGADATWAMVPTHGAAPSPRAEAALAPLGADALMVFGGRDDKVGVRNDLWRLDLATGTWTRLRAGDAGQGGLIDEPPALGNDLCRPLATASGIDAGSPEPRLGAALGRTDLGALLLFGGLGRCGALADLWRLQPDGAWLRLRGGGGACTRRAVTCSWLCAGLEANPSGPDGGAGADVDATVEDAASGP